MRKLIFALALGAILIPNYGYTLGLGEIEVNSSLNQKLTARIDLLSASPDEADTLIIKLASREEFARAGLDRPVVLSSLKFKTSVEDDRVYIDVLSPKPIREPFLNFLVLLRLRLVFLLFLLPFLVFFLLPPLVRGSFLSGPLK